MKDRMVRLVVRYDRSRWYRDSPYISRGGAQIN